MSFLALKRDRGICQCCGYVDNPEVHHIQPVIFDGMAVLDNLITLCSLCHKYAPDIAENFLDYQRSGGIRWQRIAGKLLFEEIYFHPGISILEFSHFLWELRLSVFAQSYKQTELELKPPKFNKSAWLRKNIFDLLNKDKWYTISEINELMPTPENGEISQLSLSCILHQMHLNGLLEKSSLTKQNPARTLSIYRLPS